MFLFWGLTFYTMQRYNVYLQMPYRDQMILMLPLRCFLQCACSSRSSWVGTSPVTRLGMDWMSGIFHVRYPAGYQTRDGQDIRPIFISDIRLGIKLGMDRISGIFHVRYPAVYQTSDGNDIRLFHDS